jgi:hypothetical protein
VTIKELSAEADSSTLKRAPQRKKAEPKQVRPEPVQLVNDEITATV